MNVQEQRSVAQRIAELRRLHEAGSATPWYNCDGIHTGFSGVGSRGSILGEFGLPEDATLAITTRNLLPVLLASWEVAAADSAFANFVDDDKIDINAPEWQDEFEKLDAAKTETRQSYREALKGVHDA